MLGQRMLAIAIVLLSSSITVEGQKFVVFGDSLSDSGYGAKRISQALSTSDVYPAAPYWQGRFSDGPTWVEVAANSLGSPLLNYACGGASSGATPAANSPLLPPFGGLSQPLPYLAPAFEQQVSIYLSDHGNSSNGQDVYVIAFGSNDLLQILAGYNATAEDIVTSIVAGVETLYSSGARKFVIAANDRLFAPAFSSDDTALHATQELSIEVFLALSSVVQQFSAEYPSATSVLFSFGGALLEVYGNATTLGLYNSTPCYLANSTTLNGRTFIDMGARSGSLCTDPGSHLFFDIYHPTTTVHNGVARAFLRDIAPIYWPAAGGGPALAPGRGTPNAAVSPARSSN